MKYFIKNFFQSNINEASNISGKQYKKDLIIPLSINYEEKEYIVTCIFICSF